jgi:hypothetical protein
MGIKKINLAIYPLFAFCFSQTVIAKSCSRNEIFHNLKSIEISNSLGDIVVIPSNDKDENTFVKMEGEGINEVEVVRDGDDLLINRLANKVLNHKPKRVDITIHAASKVKNLVCNMGKGDCSIERFTGDLAINSGNSNVFIKDIIGGVSLHTGGRRKVDIENIKGNIALSAGSLKNGKISNVVGNVDINTGSLHFFFFDVFGDISINGASGALDYTASKKPEFPINIKVNGASFDLNLNLSSDFKNISNKIKRLNIVSTFLPIVKHGGDITFKGCLAWGSLNVKQIKN